MFAPDGYSLIEALEDRIREVFREVEAAPDIGVIDKDDPSYEVKRLNVLAQFESFLIREVKARTLSALEGVESLSICSPQGLVLKVSKAILTRYSEFSELKLIAMAQDQHLRVVLLSAEWLVKEGRHFRNLNPSNLERMQSQEDALAGKGNPEGRLYKFSEPFRPFIGWSLVFKEDDLPKKTELKRLIGAEGRDASGGRPEKKTRALRAFDQIFPEGRQDTPWRVAAEVVSKAIEENVSIITIQRAINDRSKLDQKPE